jgi:CBS-domain-containing membrane protein
VCRVVAEGKNPMGYTAEVCMSRPVVTVATDDRIDHVVSVMKKHGIRRVPVLDDSGNCAGIIAQADLARFAEPRTVSELVRKVSRDLRST